MGKQNNLSRRAFLELAGAAATGALVTACAPQVVEKTVEVTRVVEGETVVEEVEVTRVVEETVVEEKVVEVEAQDPWLTGVVPPDTSGEMYIMSWEDEGEMRKFLLHIDRFLSTYYPNVTPEIEWGVPWGEYWTKLPTLLAAGTPPDLAWQHCTRGTVFPHKGWSINLEPYIEAYPPDGWPDDWWESSVAALSYQGDVYALPYDWAIRGLYVNREIMDAIVPYPVADDYTYEDLMEYAIAATGEDEQGNKLFGLQLGTDATFMWFIIKSMGVNFWGEDYREAYFTDPTVVDMMQYMWDLRWKHGAFPTPEDEQLMGVTGEFSFISGRVAMRAGLNDVAFRYDEGIGDNFVWGVWPMPMGETGRVAYIGNSGWFLPTGTRYPDLGYEMIRFCLSNPEVLPTTGVMGSMFVGRKSFIEWGLPTGDLAAQIPNYEHVFVDLARQAEENVPWFPGYQEFEAIYTKWMDPIFLEGEPNVEEALANLNEETNEFLAAGDW